jgi:hypothetical protein
VPKPDSEHFTAIVIRALTFDIQEAPQLNPLRPLQSIANKKRIFKFYFLDAASA